MTTSWITEPGSSGTITTTYDGDRWHLTRPETDQTVVCLFESPINKDISNTTAEFEITVKKYFSGKSGDIDHLYVSRSDGSQTDDTNDTFSPEGAEKKVQNSNKNGMSSSRPTAATDNRSKERKINNLTGSGDIVTVVGVIKEIYEVRKETDYGPDIIGKIQDPKRGNKILFIVANNVSHPYLQRGNKFKFVNAVDYYYEKEDQVELMLTKQTEYEDLGPIKDEPGNKSASSKNRSSTASSARQNNSADENLQEIAEKMIGDRDFSVEQEPHSVISDAKARARNQQRDPAIDPRLQRDTDTPDSE